MDTRPAPLMNPYLAGVLLGLVLLASFLTLGAGLGASGALARLGASTEAALAPEHVLASEYFGRWGEDPLRYYLTYMLVGIFLGGLLSAIQAGRVEVMVERGPHASVRTRLALVLGGGVLVGFASRLARGCTSGQALTGSALLLTGGLLFLVSLFVGGYALAGTVRGQWR